MDKKKLELRVTDEEKIFIKTMAASKGRKINEYILELIKYDKKNNIV